MVHPETTSIELGPLANRSIVLCGFMGVGKSSVGKKLAGRFERPFTDLDQYLVTQFGRSIAEIFTAGEEDLFRQAEEDAIRQLVDNRSPSIIALGGGAYERVATREFLRNQAFVIHLDQSWESLYPALNHLRGSRPLLQGRTNDDIKVLYTQRRETYLLADLTVEIPRSGVWVATRVVVEAIDHYVNAH
jgi:shikimate kinase